MLRTDALMVLHVVAKYPGWIASGSAKQKEIFETLQALNLTKGLATVEEVYYAALIALDKI